MAATHVHSLGSLLGILAHLQPRHEDLVSLQAVVISRDGPLPKGLTERVRMLALELRAIERIRRERFDTDIQPAAGRRWFSVAKDKPKYGRTTGAGLSWAEALHHFDLHPEYAPWPPPRDDDDPTHAGVN